jgi:hypothetical protein
LHVSQSLPVCLCLKRIWEFKPSIELYSIPRSRSGDKDSLFHLLCVVSYG